MHPDDYDNQINDATDQFEAWAIDFTQDKEFKIKAKQYIDALLWMSDRNYAYPPSQSGIATSFTAQNMIDICNKKDKEEATDPIDDNGVTILKVEDLQF